MRIRLLFLAGFCLAVLAGLVGAAREQPKDLEIVVDDRTLRPGSDAEAVELGRLIALGKENADSFNTLDGSREGPLHKAAELGRLAVVEYLLSHGARVNLQRGDLFEPLTIATYCRHLAVVEYLLDHGADVTGGKTYGYNPIQYAAQGGFLEIAELLLARGADVRSRDGGGRTPLSLAALPEMVRLLVNHGADVNAKDHWGATPLCRMVEARRLGAVKALLERNADPNASYVNNGNFQLRVMLSLDLTPLCVATAQRNLPMAEMLLSFKAAVNVKTASGWTPAHFAAATGATEMIELLASRGANLNATNASGATPLMTALLRRNNEAAAALLARHADIEAKDDEGRTPLQQTIIRGLAVEVDFLLDRGANANANAKDGSKQTALELLKKAAEEGNGDFATDPKEARQRIEASLLKHGAIRSPAGGAAPASSGGPAGGPEIERKNSGSK